MSSNVEVDDVLDQPKKKKAVSSKEGGSKKENEARNNPKTHKSAQARGISIIVIL